MMAEQLVHKDFMDELAIGKFVHIVGCGLSGVSALKFLQARGYELLVHDEAEEPKQAETIKALVGREQCRFGPSCFAGIEQADSVILSPGISLKHERIQQALAAGVQVIGDVELFMRINSQPCILITGSNGKSTVAALLGEVLQDFGVNASVCGNYGLPVLDALAQGADSYVIEISSFQLETTPGLHSDAAVLLNVSEDHMDRYDSYAAYTQTKLSVFREARTRVINLDDDYAKQLDLRTDDIGISEHDSERATLFIDKSGNEAVIRAAGQDLARESEFKLMGAHNLFNIAVTLALAKVMDVPYAAALETIRQFPGLEHRTEFVATIDGVTWINDSKATNVGATVAAVNGISKPIILLLGGMAKDADFSALCAYLEGKVKKVLVFGRDQQRIIDAIADCADYEVVKDLDDMVAQAAECASAGDVVLFSPACASFDMFDSYQDRGRKFKARVRAGGSV